MALFKVEENRYINTEHIADAKYFVHYPITLTMRREDQVQAPPAGTPHFDILLLNEEEISLWGEEADTAWAAFQAAAGQKPADPVVE